MRFGLFNGITLFIMAATLGVAALRAAGRNGSKWPLVYYPVLLAYALGFKYSVNPVWAVAGLVFTLMVRFGVLSVPARLAELLVLGYVLWRGLALLMMW
jgi:hypothetical protein